MLFMLLESPLLALVVTLLARRLALGVSVALSEHEVHWRAFLESLKQRGLGGVQLITSDDHAGLRAARLAVLGGLPSAVLSWLFASAFKPLCASFA